MFCYIHTMPDMFCYTFVFIQHLICIATVYIYNVHVFMICKTQMTL
jgi:hypothetical protein